MLVVLVAIKLEDYANLTFAKLRALDVKLSFKVIQELYATVLRFALNRDREELLESHVLLEELHGFAQDTMTCLTYVRGKEEKERAATERAQHILCVKPVAHWREAFRQLVQEFTSPPPESPTASPRVGESDASPSPTLLTSRSRSRGGSMSLAPNKPFSSPTSAFRKRVSSIGSTDSALRSRSRSDSMSQYAEPSSPRAASTSYFGDAFPSVPEVEHEEIATTGAVSHDQLVDEPSAPPEEGPVSVQAVECPSTEPCSGADTPFE